MSELLPAAKFNIMAEYLRGVNTSIVWQGEAVGKVMRSVVILNHYQYGLKLPGNGSVLMGERYWLAIQSHLPDIPEYIWELQKRGLELNMCNLRKICSHIRNYGSEHISYQIYHDFEELYESWGVPKGLAKDYIKKYMKDNKHMFINFSNGYILKFDRY